MNIKLFQALVDQLLKAHFGITIDDTHFTDECAIEAHMKMGDRPYVAVNQYTDEMELSRTDSAGRAWGGLLSAWLKPQDEVKALETATPSGELSSEPVCCSKCGARTEFEDVVGIRSGMQHHKCSNTDCGHEFLAEPASSMYADSIIRGAPEKFNGIHVHRVVNRNADDSPEGSNFELAGDTETATAYAVYLSTTDSEPLPWVDIEPVGDFALPDQALAYAASLHKQYGWPVKDYTPMPVKTAMEA